jgi:uridine kinase
LVKAYSPNASLISYDWYYYSHEGLTMEEKAKINYDDPRSFDKALFLEHLNAIKRGEDADLPRYDYAIHDRLKEPLHFHPTPIVFVDGILCMNMHHPDEFYDYAIYVDADSDIRLSRRILRDVRERGRTPDSVISQYLATVRPMHHKYVEPARYLCDFIFRNNDEDGLDGDQVDILIKKINRLLPEELHGRDR